MWQRAKMQLLYMDESGVEEIEQGTSHFVLLGVMIPADRWKEIANQLEQVKATFDLLDAEIHTAWMHRRYAEQDSVSDFDRLSPADRRRESEKAIRQRAGVLGVAGNMKKIKAYRRESASIRPYLHLTIGQRRECLIALASKLATFTDVRIFAEAISKADFTPGPMDTPYEMAFEQVLTRSQACLAGKGDLGILISDNNSKAAPRLTKLSRKFHKTGTFYRAIPNIVETPLFVDSSLTSMIQMADLCAFSLRRVIENGESWLWDLVESRADRAGGVCVGARHFTGKRNCVCRICIAHGRRMQA
jgi:hypothetical protein